MTSVMRIEGLTFSYGETEVLRNLSFSVLEKDFFVILGPNGSGKSTLLRLMTGILKSGKGLVEVLGKPLSTYSRSALARALALVPQSPPVDFPFAVSELVLMGRAPHQGFLGLENKKDLDVARNAMAITGIENLARRKVYQLSGGERQRVFIARAICQEPRILLLDEPTASLDLAHQIRVMDLMKTFQEKRGLTIVMVSHDLNLAAMYANRLLLLKEGQIVKDGPPEDVLTYQTLEETYGCPLLVDESPLGGFLRITSVPGRFLRKDLQTAFQQEIEPGESNERDGIRVPFSHQVRA